MTRKLVVEADGGSRGNPGPAGYGALVRDPVTGEVLAEMGDSLGTTTNNVAEYSGLVAGLRAIVDGTIGKVKDFFVFRSQFVAKTGSSPVNTHNVAFTKNAIGLVIRRLPQPLPGTGAIAEYAELGNFGMRVVMSYQPNTLAQQFTVDVLYGCGVLRNSLGVQVNT